MGATQSKKRRKDKQKKRRSSSSLDLPRSSSLGSLRASGMSSSSSACPLCPHCRTSLSWSSDHSLTHSLCLHHAKQWRHQEWDSAHSRQGLGGESASSWDKDTFESCPDCFLPSASADSLRLCEISNQDYDELSTMSLNRHLSGRNVVKPAGGIVQSKSAEFSDLGSRFNQKQNTKENVNPALCDSSGRQTSHSKKVTSSHAPSTAKQGRSPSSDPSRKRNTLALPPAPTASHSAPLIPPPVHARLLHDSGSKETKSNSSLLDDEDAMVSRWAKHKQMAQELRKLRMHLQNEEVVKQQAASQTASLDSKKLACNVEEEEEAVTEKRTPAAGISPDVSPHNAERTADGVPRQDSMSGDDALDTSPTPTSPTRRSVRSKFSRLSNYRYLDNHPVMTRLQNEQNNRLEKMERRMEEIRISAMQEAQRRKFAEIFPAKDDDSETQKLLREARESLERMKEEKRKKTVSLADVVHGQDKDTASIHRSSLSSDPQDCNMALARGHEADSRSQDDSGEIIPVRVVSSSREVTPVSSKQTMSRPKKTDQTAQSAWLKGDWPDINLGQPLTWLWLPFMLFPLVLRMLVSMIINSLPTSVTPRTGNSANTGCSNPDRNRNLSRHRRKKSC